MRPTPLLLLVLSAFLACLCGNALTARALRAEDAEPAPPAPRTPEPHTDEQLREHQVIEAFEEAYAAKDLGERIRALESFGRWRHKKVLKVLKRVWEREGDLELKTAAAKGLGQQTPFRKEAGLTLVRGLDKLRKLASRENPEGDEVLQQKVEANLLIAGIRAVGQVGYAEGWDDLADFIEHPHDFVAGETMLTAGRLKEYRALPVLLEWFNFYPDGHSWSGGSTSVDTGAPGSADAAAAKAKWGAKYGRRAKKARPNAWEMLVQSLEMITGTKFEKPDELKAWMDENKSLLQQRRRAPTGG